MYSCIFMKFPEQDSISYQSYAINYPVYHAALWENILSKEMSSKLVYFAEGACQALIMDEDLCQLTEKIGLNESLQ